jgi:hypothetical protein
MTTQYDGLGAPMPTAERLAELQKAQTNQTILGMQVAPGTTIPVSQLPPDASGVVPTGAQAQSALLSGGGYAVQQGSVYSTLPQVADASERFRNTEREESIKSDALRSMGFDPSQTTLEQFLSQPGREQLYRETVNTFAYGIANPVFKTFSTGQDAIVTPRGAQQTLGTYDKWAQQQAQERASLGVNFGGGMPSALENQMLDLIKGQMDTHSAYNNELIANIKAQSAAAQKAQEVQNRLAQGQSAWQLAKMGALGTTMSGQSYLLSVEQAGLDKLASLAADFQSKILEAQKNMNDGNYKMATQMLDFAMKIEDRISNEKQLQFENSLKIAQEQRKQEEFNRQMMDWAQKDISNLISLGMGPESFDENDKREYEAKAGYPPGTFDRLYEAVKSVQEADSYLAQLEADKKKYDILKDIPPDTVISVGGRLESGLKYIAPKIYEQVITDANGAVQLLTYDENTGKMEVHNTGIFSAVRASGGGGGGGGGGGSGTPVAGHELASVVDDLYYQATGLFLDGKYRAQAMNMFEQQLVNNANEQLAKQAAIQKYAGKFNDLSPYLKTTEQIYNDTINSYYTNPSNNPFSRSTPKPQISTTETIEYGTKNQKIGGKITTTTKW